MVVEALQGWRVTNLRILANVEILRTDKSKDTG
jgi:hypothetical protein